MKAYSYVVVHDGGFAPNPFGGYCTLATCKPLIRKNGKVGDWIFGMGSARNAGNGKLIYAMKVDEVLPLEEYGADQRFDNKHPKAIGSLDEQCGDNIYYHENGEWRQRSGFHGPETMEHDLKGVNALVAKQFYYFGRNAVEVPDEHSSIVCKGRGHRCRFDESTVAAFVRWLEENYEPGIHGLPHMFPATELANFNERRPSASGACEPGRKREPASAEANSSPKTKNSC